MKIFKLLIYYDSKIKNVVATSDLERLVAPKALFPSSTIGAFTPSDALTDARRLKVISGANVLIQAGFNVTFASNALKTQPMVTGGMRGRDTDIAELLSDKETNALIATHGGKSCIDMVSANIDYSLIRKQRKPIIGFSDVCIILNLIIHKAGLISFYGPNVLSKIDQSYWSDMRSLNTDSPDFGCSRLFNNTFEHICVRSGASRGYLFGGNLECFVNGLLLSKADYAPPRPGIFIWESSGLTAGATYQILTALRLSGFLNGVSGMIIGDAFRDPIHSISICLESVLQACEGTSFPIVFIPGFGHGSMTENPIIPLGAKALVDSATGIVEMLDRYITCQ